MPASKAEQADSRAKMIAALVVVLTGVAMLVLGIGRLPTARELK